MQTKARQVFCPKCNASVPTQAINERSMTARCSKCGHLFAIPRPPSKESSTTSRDVHDFDGTVPERPKQVSKEHGGQLSLNKRWFTWAVIPICFFTLVWDGFMIVWYVAAFKVNAPLIMSLILFIFPILHLAIAVFLTSKCIFVLFNRTKIYTDGYSLVIKHRPIMWWHDKAIVIKDIKWIQIVEARTIKQSASYSPISANCYELLLMEANHEVTLLHSLSREEARFIAFEIANKLKVDFKK